MANMDCPAGAIYPGVQAAKLEQIIGSCRRDDRIFPISGQAFSQRG